MKTQSTITRSDDLIASYSSRGPTYIDLTAKPDVVAPGNMVDSLLAPGSTLALACIKSRAPCQPKSTRSLTWRRQRV